MGRVGQGRRHPPALTHPQHGDFGAEGVDLWLAASSDQRISIWAADWPRGHCELVDWLSSPSPTLTEVRVLRGTRGGDGACPPDCSMLRPSAGPQPSTTLSCCLLPLGWGTAGVCGPRRASRGGVLQPSPEAGMCGARSLRDPGPGRGGSHSVSTGGGEDPAAVLCRVPEPVP